MTTTMAPPKKLPAEHIEAINNLWDWLADNGVPSDQLESYLHAQNGRLLEPHELRVLRLQLRTGEIKLAEVKPYIKET